MTVLEVEPIKQPPLLPPMASTSLVSHYNVGKVSICNKIKVKNNTAFSCFG
jgi:hypothetical protein